MIQQSEALRVSAEAPQRRRGGTRFAAACAAGTNTIMSISAGALAAPANPVAGWFTFGVTTRVRRLVAGRPMRLCLGVTWRCRCTKRLQVRLPSHRSPPQRAWRGRPLQRRSGRRRARAPAPPRRLQICASIDDAQRVRWLRCPAVHAPKAGPVAAVLMSCACPALLT